MQTQACTNFIDRCFAVAVGATPRDVALTVRTPEGEPGAALTRIATADGDVIVVGQEPALTVRRVLHGLVSRYCRRHARCPVVVVAGPHPGTTARMRSTSEDQQPAAGSLRRRLSSRACSSLSPMRRPARAYHGPGGFPPG